ncbi:MAG: hypothetical protein GTO45_39375 [Candidatus Aminicenantes bacterium]|nr:hypothetical protein [Candidatus Aminicenantes bacterium]NIM84690.1 hypothetical protein [Candidatus Aminicenantes bacterium]NIN24189.1 hypothetical protein [Candidatus Aminicenantes bacterium]NIN47914.1 hypothetical protein [Candidatus Aminicenantes bacterium]NIN90852.1 hypothetical protein [Candidatus Aminicenantes bacterium]
MTIQRTLLIICLTIILAVPALADTNTDKKTNETEPLFQSNEILELTLEYDVKAFRKDRGDKRKYHPAKLSYIDSEGKTISLDVQIRTRGKLRRLYLRCQVPPIKMKFNKKQTPNTIFAGQKTLKMVTHCKNTPKAYPYYYLQEYLIYRMYNLLTEKSFRVRLANITYVDSQKTDNTFTNYAFFIENYKKMAKRNKGKTSKLTKIHPMQTDFATSTLVSVFQYMVGNVDWSIRSSHNIKLITIEEENKKKYYPVPFDFDHAGLIDVDYARPDPNLPIKSVRERLYRGFCKSLEQFNQTFVIFHKHKNEFYALFQDFTPLPENLKKRSLKYLDGFYQIIQNPKLVKRYFINNYRGRPFPKR